MTLAEIENINKIDQNEFDDLTQLMFSTFALKTNYKTSYRLKKKKELLESFMSFVSKYLELNFTKSRTKKIELIHFLDKLQMQKELLEIKKGEVDLKNIKATAKRLGKKSQSAFSSE